MKVFTLNVHQTLADSVIEPLSYTMTWLSLSMPSDLTYSVRQPGSGRLRAIVGLGSTHSFRSKCWDPGICSLKKMLVIITIVFNSLIYFSPYSHISIAKRSVLSFSTTVQEKQQNKLLKVKCCYQTHQKTECWTYSDLLNKLQVSSCKWWPSGI